MHDRSWEGGNLLVFALRLCICTPDRGDHKRCPTAEKWRLASTPPPKLQPPMRVMWLFLKRRRAVATAEVGPTQRRFAWLFCEDCARISKMVAKFSGERWTLQMYVSEAKFKSQAEVTLARTSVRFWPSPREGTRVVLWVSQGQGFAHTHYDRVSNPGASLSSMQFMVCVCVMPQRFTAAQQHSW